MDEATRSASVNGCGHDVGFYENDEFLITTILEHLAPALEAGDTAVVIATANHRSQIEEALDARVGDQAPGSPPRIVMMDAAATLERFMVDGMPDAARFEAAMTEVIDAAATGSAPVRAYGEMVAVLWDHGNVAAAIALEDLWNDLGSSRPFALLCGYPMRAFGREGTAFRDVCRRHGRVIPSESYSSLSDPDERLRAVALLQGEVAASGGERLALQDGHTQLEKALDRLRELERVRKEFVAMVVHDIRGPAAVIAASLDLLQDGWDDLDQDSIRDLLAGAAGNAIRIERLAADMLALSRLDAGGFSYDLGAVALDRVVDKAVGEVAAATGRSIRVDIVADPLPDAFADEQRQRQILGNLLGNAVKFSAEDTEVVVTIAHVGDELSVGVRDQGVGIAADDQTTLFHPFTRVRSSGARVDGFGLGLYTAKVLVEGQRGRIRVDSTPGEGSTFTYTVPVVPPG